VYYLRTGQFLPNLKSNNLYGLFLFQGQPLTRDVASDLIIEKIFIKELLIFGKFVLLT